MKIHRIDKILKHVIVLLVFIINFNVSCSSFEKDIVSLSNPGGLNQEFECRKWNATIVTKGDSFQKLLQATFEPFPGYERCFTYYNVYLYLLKPNRFECNLLNGMEIKCKTVHLNNQGKHGGYNVKFTNLKAKYYCIMIEPCAEECYETMLSSNVVRIEGKVRKIPESVVEREEVPLINPSDTEVFILYYSDGVTKQLVDCLTDFLRECAKFNVTVIDDRHAPIHFEPYSWLDEHLQCCSIVNGKCSCNRRVIIVMTEWVVNYMRAKRKVVKGLNEMAKNESCAIPLCSSVFDDMQADWFCYGLDKILIDWSKCMKDYTHFFVIYFNDTLYDEREDTITIASDVRFSIQRHLLKLCQEMNNSFKDITHKEKLMKCFDKHPIKDILSVPDSHT